MIYISFWSTPSKVTQGQRCIRSEKSLLRLKKGVVLWGGGVASSTLTKPLRAAAGRNAAVIYYLIESTRKMNRL